MKVLQCIVVVAAFSSTPAIPGTESLETMDSYSSIDVALTLTIMGTSQVAQTGAFSEITASTPTFCNPIEFSIPAGV